MPIAFVLLLAALLAGGGVTAVANDAKPGDALYGYKIAVNENVQSALAFSDAGKAKVETALANQRLSEAENVASKGTLTPEVQQQLEANFQAHADAAQKLVESLQAKKDFQGASNASGDLGSSLAAHAQILAKLSTASAEPVEQKSLTDLKTTVSAESQQSTKLDQSIQSDVSKETSPDVQAAAEGRLTSAQNKIVEVQAFLDLVKDKVGADTAAKATTQLDVAKKSVADGQAKLDAKLFSDAFALFSDAQKQAEAAKSMAQAKNQLNVDIEGEDRGERGDSGKEDGTESDKQKSESQKQESEKQRESLKQQLELKGDDGKVNVQAKVGESD